MRRQRAWLGYGATFATGGLVGGIVTLAIHARIYPHHVPPSLPPLVSAFGSVLSGCAALLGAVLVARGFVRWNDRQAREQQAKIAGDALAAALDVCNVLRRIVEREQPSPPPRTRVELLEHWRTLLLGDFVARFRQARTLVEVYFSDEIAETFAGLFADMTKLSDALQEATVHALGDGSVPPAFEKPIDDARIQIALLLDITREELKEELRPYVRLEPIKLPTKRPHKAEPPKFE